MVNWIKSNSEVVSNIPHFIDHVLGDGLLVEHACTYSKDGELLYVDTMKLAREYNLHKLKKA